MKHKPPFFYSSENGEGMWIPLYATGVQAGFPSPADDYIEASIDLNKELIRDHACTFLVRATGDSMIGDGIFPDDLLIVDKSVEPFDGCIAVCFIDGEFTVKRVEFKKDHILLVPSNKKYKSIKLGEESNFMIWGVVRYSIKKY